MDTRIATNKEIQQFAEAHEGVACLGTLSGSPSDKAGIKKGDIIIAVNGIRVKSAEEWAEAKGETKDLSVDLIRYTNGAPIEFSVKMQVGGYQLTMESLEEAIEQNKVLEEGPEKIVGSA